MSLNKNYISDGCQIINITVMGMQSLETRAPCEHGLDVRVSRHQLQSQIQLGSQLAFVLSVYESE